MKNVNRITATAIILGIGALSAVVLAATRTETIAVSGMCCQRCALSIDYALKEIDGVEAAQTSLAKGAVEVTYDDAKVTVEQLHEAIRELGFEVKQGGGASCSLRQGRGACCSLGDSATTPGSVF